MSSGSSNGEDTLVKADLFPLDLFRLSLRCYLGEFSLYVSPRYLNALTTALLIYSYVCIIYESNSDLF